MGWTQPPEGESDYIHTEQGDVWGPGTKMDNLGIAETLYNKTLRNSKGEILGEVVTTRFLEDGLVLHLGILNSFLGPQMWPFPSIEEARRAVERAAITVMSNNPPTSYILAEGGDTQAWKNRHWETAT